MIKSIFILVVFHCCFLHISAQDASNGYLVFSISGKVQVSDAGKQREVKVFDELSSIQKITVYKGGGLTYVNKKDKSLHAIEKPGTYTIAELLKSESGQPAVLSKFMQYALDNFIHKESIMAEKHVVES